MALFELTLALLLAAIILTGIARRLEIPYPPLLALAGAGIAFLPFAPTIEIEPELALALFVAPVLLDAAFDTSPRDLKRYALPLILLALVAVILTTAAVALVGWKFAGLPIAAAIALGAIVAPPDAAAAAAVLDQFRPPRRIMAILQGESLLNDATALLIYRMAVVAAAGPLLLGSAVPMVALSAIGSMVLGYVLARLFGVIIRRVDDPASATILQFVGTFGVWMLADRIGLSAIITIVVYAMTIARTAPRDTPARNRVSSYSVWETAVFVLNVLAFVMMGLQARPIIERLSGGDMAGALLFAGAVLLTVIVVRLAWVLGCGALIRSLGLRRSGGTRRGQRLWRRPADRLVRHARPGHAGDRLWLAVRLSRPRSDRACRLRRGHRHAGAAGPDAEAAACAAAAQARSLDRGRGVARPRRDHRDCSWTVSRGKTQARRARSATSMRRPAKSRKTLTTRRPRPITTGCG